MEVRATAKYIRVQPRKVRIIADEVRGTNALHTASLLRYHTSKSAHALHKVLISAIANAQENHNLPAEGLRISAITVDEGPRLKRMQARAMGRGNRIIKKTSHITVTVEDYDVARPVRPHGTKPKPRPTLGHPTRGKKSTPAAAAPAHDLIEPATEIVEPATEVVEPATEIVEPATEVVEPADEVVERTAEAAPAEAESATSTEEPAAEATPDATEEAPASDEKGAE
jgi:large subunit ribosomal protein L22